MQRLIKPLARILAGAFLGIGYVAASPPMHGLALPPPAPTNSQSQPEMPSKPADAVVTFRDNRLIIKANTVPLEKILVMVTQETGVSFFIKGSAETPVTADIQSMDLEKGIKRLIHGLNSVFYYGPSQPGAQDIQLTTVLIISNPESRTISAIRPSDDANPVQATGHVPDHNLFEEIDRLEEAADADESAVDELARLAEFDENTLRRVAALEALGESDAPQYADLLYNIALRDDDVSVRVAAVEALGNVSAGQATTDYLLEILNDRHPQVRAAAVEALAYVGDESATGALVKALKDDGSLVRTTAAEALADIGDKSAIPALIEALDDSDEEVREFARDALEEMGIKEGLPQK